LAAAWTLLGLADNDFAQGLKVAGKGMVRSVHGQVQYSKGDQWLEARPDLPIATGTTLRTGADSYVNIFLNDASVIRLAPLTTMQFQELARSGAERSADTETILDLKSGTLLGNFGNFNQLSPNALYEVHTSNGMARILGGVSFKIEAVPQPDGAFQVTFASVSGDLMCSAWLAGQAVNKVLRAGEFWTPGDKGNEYLHPPGAQGPGGAVAPPAPVSAQEMQALRKIAGDYNSFGFQLLTATSKAYPNTNVLLSPVGAAIALSATASGAQGATRQEITHALGLEALPPSGFDQAGETMLDYLSTLAGNLRLEMADGWWFDDKVQAKPNFIAKARNFYNGEVKSARLQNPDAVVDVNAWVANRTHGAIPVAFQSLEPGAGMVVVDAFYFKARWAACFDKLLTQDQPFHFAQGGSVTHPQMQKTDYYQYSKTPAFQLIALPYQASATMYVLLPNGSLEKLMEGLTAEHWEEWISSLERRKGLLALPRFKLDSYYDLKLPLQALGIHLAFQDAGADFSGMTDTPSWISQVEEKTFVNVDEEGTEGSAAATDFFRGSQGTEPPTEPPPFKMIVDHPFLVVIRENGTGTILCMGAIMNPHH
jgi:serpin B